MAELSQIERDGVVYDFKDTTAREANETNASAVQAVKQTLGNIRDSSIPFSNVDLVLRVDATIEPLEDGTYPDPVYFDTDLEGNPLAMKAFIILTDQVSSVSYCRIEFNGSKYHENPNTVVKAPLNLSNLRLVFITSPSGCVATMGNTHGKNTTFLIPGVSHNNSGDDLPFGELTEVKSVSLSYISSISYVKIFEIVERSK